ncbi:hypothetical protein F5148DRAFT_1286230 [Russula earlei]|uniref:Uncharacterized protein n=1 Tax=Russula earlei TaxID=71964 RepID=A0ACC0U518_9AGAM|nr:hypothetical protein F5148DRAFT_1286230 [Russula earlei]
MKQKLLLLLTPVLITVVISVACKKQDSSTTGASISALSCSSATFSATATINVAYSGTATIAYTGGNGVTYTAGTAISSTGVTGLTATLAAGTLASGAGNLIYNISGTPTSSGTASFAISFGGQSCTLALTVNTAATTDCSSSTGVAQIICLANAFKATLSSSQITTLQLSYTLTNAEKWSNLPAAMSARNGIRLGDLSSTQLAAAQALIQAMTGTTANEGYDEVKKVWAADDYLNANGGGSDYGSGNYYIAFLGTPATTGTFEILETGHHKTVANTYSNGALIGATPHFEAVEPVSFTSNGTTYAPISQERDAFVALLASLSSTQLSTALSSSTFTDLLLVPGQEWKFPTTYSGLQCNGLSTAQKQLVLNVIKTYTEDIDDADAATALATYTADLDNTYITYSGTTAISTNHAQLTVKEQYVLMQLQTPLEIIELASKQQVNLQSSSSVDSLQQYYIRHLSVADSLHSQWTITVGKIFIRETKDPLIGNYRQIVADIYLRPNNTQSLRNFTLYCDVVIHQIPNQSILFSVAQDWQNGVIQHNARQIGIIALDMPTGKIFPLQIQLAEGSWLKGFTSMLHLGMQHIKEGTDHLLFLIVLLLPAMLLTWQKKWGGFGGTKYSLTRLLKIVTAFTIGHSITLLTGALGWLKLPAQPVEILIAFSILVSAIHAIYPIFPGKETYVAAGFGLIHGMAFASVLAGLNLGAGTLALSILGFNLGIELMQLCIIALIIPWLILLSKTPYYSWFRVTGALLAAMAALAWIAERSSGKANLITVFLERITQHSGWFIIALAVVSSAVYVWNKTINTGNSYLQRPKKLCMIKSLVATGLLFIACSFYTLAQDVFDKQGHRGCRGLLPENSIPAMQKAVDLGVTLEMDISFSRDGIAIVSHDQSIPPAIALKPNGDTISKKEAQSLFLYQMVYDTIRRYIFGQKYYPSFPNQQKVRTYIPKLEEVIDSAEAWAQRYHKPLPHYNIETKTTRAGDYILHPPPGQFVELLMKIVKGKHIGSRTIIQSFDVRTLQVLHAKYPYMVTSLLVEGRELKDNLALLGFTPSIYSPDYRLVNEALVNECHAAGIKIIPWTVNSGKDITQLKEWGVDGIISDYPDQL